MQIWCKLISNPACAYETSFGIRTVLIASSIVVQALVYVYIAEQLKLIYCKIISIITVKYMHAHNGNID